MKKTIRALLGVRDETAEIVKDDDGQPVPDSELRDFENVPLKEDIDEYFAREVLPHVPDAWMDRSKDKVGYEISFTKYFYEYTPLRSTADIAAELLKLDEETENLLREVVKAMSALQARWVEAIREWSAIRLIHLRAQSARSLTERVRISRWNVSVKTGTVLTCRRNARAATTLDFAKGLHNAMRRVRKSCLRQGHLLCFKNGQRWARLPWLQGASAPGPTADLPSFGSAAEVDQRAFSIIWLHSTGFSSLRN